MKKILILSICLLALACKKEIPSTFTLTGSTNNMEDGVQLFLKDAISDEVIDSVKVLNNQFSFNSRNFTAPTRVVLHDANYKNYSFMWIENGPMHFDASNTDFRNAKISGSETEMLNGKLKDQIAELGDDHSNDDKRKALEIEFVRKNPNSIVSANILSIYSTTWGKAIVAEIFEPMSNENKTSSYGLKVAKYLRLNKNPKLGETYADFSMVNTNGKSEKLSNYTGKIVLLEFWAAWCGPCRQENPNLVKTYQRYKDLGFKIVAVSLDINKQDWLNAIEKDGLDWIHLSDLKGNENEAGMIYGVSGIPDNFLIDKDGQIVARNLRGANLDEALNELLMAAK